MNQGMAITVRLGRQVRFALPLDDTEASMSGGATNNYAGWPRPNGVAPYYTVTLEVRGPTDPRTGMLVNIRTLDRIVRGEMIGLIAQRIGEDDRDPAGWVASAWRELGGKLRADAVALSGLTFHWTPYHALSVRGDDGMVYLSEQFEFAAAHRLWSDRLSEQDNREAFGKCSNPAGHGHNYVVEVTVSGRPGELGLGRLERTVRAEVIERLDHKNLNCDCPEFAGLNPTVENIARVIWDLLSAPDALGESLHAVRVHETSKTWAEVRADDAGH